MNARAWALGAAVLLSSVSSFAADTKVDVVVNVVAASNHGTSIEPPSLAKMKDEFAKKNLKFTSFRLLQTKTVTVTQATPAELPLPNTSTARLRLVELKDGKATIAVELRQIESKIQLGREGSVFVHAGKHENGELILAFESGSKPRG